MKLPATLQAINVELSRRREQGLSGRMQRFEATVLRDDDVGLFLRVTVHLDDGSSFEVDTQEASALLRQAITN